MFAKINFGGSVVSKFLVRAGVLAGFICALGGTSLRAQAVSWSTSVSLTQGSSIYFNLLTGETSSVGGSENQFSIFNSVGSSADQTVIAGTSATSKLIYDFTEAKNLDFGTSISDSDAYWGSGNLVTYIFSSSTLISNFSDASDGYVGLTFQSEDQTYYGWASLIRAEDSTLVTLTGFGYNSLAGAASFAGEAGAAVPEPSTYAVLAAVAAFGFVVLRRRATASQRAQTAIS